MQICEQFGERVFLSRPDELFISPADIAVADLWLAGKTGEFINQSDAPSIVSVLKGAKTTEDAIDYHLQTNNDITITETKLGDVTRDWVRASSMEGAKSSGVLDLKLLTPNNLAGRDVLVIEDIADTLLTMEGLSEFYLSEVGVNSLRFIFKIRKLGAAAAGLELGEDDIVGMNIANDFVVGNGMDYKQKYRELPYIIKCHTGDDNPDLGKPLIDEAQMTAELSVASTSTIYMPGVWKWDKDNPGNKRFVYAQQMINDSFDLQSYKHSA
jgi:hypoxanthine phosphoribosyltransferase